ncbi:MAG: hypothetical protein LBH94_03450 [Deltaproteobacteria bacterium]|jgi:hypothetical protein|nr:hypothetical protein [Deltaproteobacteria bacterium]
MGGWKGIMKKAGIPRTMGKVNTMISLKNIYTMHGMTGIAAAVGLCLGGVMIVVGLVRLLHHWLMQRYFHEDSSIFAVIARRFRTLTRSRHKEAESAESEDGSNNSS